MHNILVKARQQVEGLNSGYFGALNPSDAHQFLLDEPSAILLDVRTQAELDWVGAPLLRNPQQHVHVEWAHYPGMSHNRDFISMVEQAIPHKQVPILVICRSANRSKHAARALANAGYETVIDVLEGFEGEKSKHQPRKSMNGWCFRQLPWVSA